MRRRGFTIVEMVVVMILMGITLVILYEIYYGIAGRAQLFTKRAEGQMSVRILLVKMRYELKKAVQPVHIGKQNQMIEIMLSDQSRKPDDPDRFYFMEYEYMPESFSMVERRKNHEKKVVDERLWLGGSNQIMRFKCYDTNENDRILYQFYRVVVELDHYEIKMRDAIHQPGAADEKKQSVRLTTTVYPRRVNMELRIEVPQEPG